MQTNPVVYKITILVTLFFGVLLLSTCQQGSPTTVPISPTQTADNPTTPPQPTAVPTAEPTATLPAPTASPSAVSGGPAISSMFPPLVNAVPAGVLPQLAPLGNYVAFAWNNLGMHCFQADYSTLLVLPPYNVFWTQVIARGDSPAIVKSGVSVDYSVPQVTQPTKYNNFWDYAKAYGWDLKPGIGLTGKGTSGTMDAAGDHFIAEGVPVIDRNDDGTWDPYPFFLVDVKTSANQVIAQTVNVAPASSEMRCDLCHQGSTYQEVMQSVLKSHDNAQKTSLLAQAQSGKPVLCNACHSDPAMGVMKNNGATESLSGAMHTFHADKMKAPNMPASACQSCHPGPSTQCLRDAMAEKGITCEDCHGTLADVGSATRTPWVNLPQCQSCHTANLVKAEVKHIDNPNDHLTATANDIYRNSKAHGGGGIYCAACHGSPHAIYPTITERDNQQSIRLQGTAGMIKDCTVCHSERQDDGFWHFGGGD